MSKKDAKDSEAQLPMPLPLTFLGQEMLSCHVSCIVPMRICASVDGLFPLGFSHLVCLYVCLCVSRRGGLAWIDAWVMVSLCVTLSV